MDSTKPKVLLLGGVGFIGRNFVKYLVDHKLASKIVVVDKVLPATGFLNKASADAFNDPTVEFKQANLCNAGSVKSIFESEKFNYVFNLAGETKYGQTEDIYKEKVLDLAVICGTAAKKTNVDRFIEVSTAQVYDSDKKPHKETDKLKPWTNIAKYKAKAEEQLRALGLPLIVVRPAIVYGPGDTSGIAPRLIAGAVYTELKEKMQFLWDGDLKLNTVHVGDVCKALWFLAEKGTVGEAYNLADSGDTDQGRVNQLLEKIFGIKTDFVGSAMSHLAKMNLKSVAEDVNDKHMKPWLDLCKRQGILHSPLTAYIDLELLSNNHLSVDGSRITTLGFTYDHSALTEEGMREIINYFAEQNLFPKITN